MPLETSLLHEPKFWRLGLSLALERRTDAVTARAVFREMRAPDGLVIASQIDDHFDTEQIV